MISRHLGSLTAASWVSFDFNVSYSSCWGYSLINTLKLKKRLWEIANRVLRGDGGIGAAPRPAAAHRAADTNAHGGHLNQTPGESVCLSHVAVCAVLGLPAPSKAPHNLRIFRLFWKKIDGTHSKPNSNKMSFGTFGDILVQFGLECVSKKIVFKSNEVSTHCGMSTYSVGVHRCGNWSIPQLTVGLQHFYLESIRPGAWKQNYSFWKQKEFVIRYDVKLAQLARVQDCQFLGRRCNSIKNPKIPRTQIYMELNNIDPQEKVLNCLLK